MDSAVAPLLLGARLATGAPAAATLLTPVLTPTSAFGRRRAAFDDRLVSTQRHGPQIERAFAQAETLSWAMARQTISSAGSVAWTAGDVVIHVGLGGTTLDLPHRLTTVLERRDGSWVLLQMHLSVASAAQVLGQSFPTEVKTIGDAFMVAFGSARRAEIQVGRQRIPVRARIAEDDERSRLRARADDVSQGQYTIYQSRTKRPIPVVVLEPR